MEIIYDLRNQIETRWAPDHLRNVRIPRWDGILRELRMYWAGGTETIIDTSFYERLPNAPRPKKPVEKW
jgi:hypothetical protein